MKVYSKNIILLLIIIAITICSNKTTGAQTPTGQILKIELDVNDSDGVIENINTIQAFVKIANVSNSDQDVKVGWEILTDNHIPLFDVVIPQKIKKGDTLNCYCPPFQFNNPGFYQIRTKLKTAEKSWQKKMTVGADPEKIMTLIDAEPDFEAFWDLALKELEAVAPNVKLIPVEAEQKTNTRLYKVELNSIENLTVRGWLEIPQKPGKYPALLRVPGYTENLKPIDKYDDLIVFSFNTRDHGESDNTGPRTWDMWVRGMHDKNEFYYKDIILDCIQALNYLCDRYDVDTSRIAIWGGSQGGGLSFTTAALDDRIDLCIADIPFLCDYQRYFEISHWNKVDTWFKKHPEQNWETLFKTLSYFDTKNMAHKITCPVYMGIGLQDEVCPPATSFVTYNYLTCRKEYSVYKYEKHSQPKLHYERRFQTIRSEFGMD